MTAQRACPFCGAPDDPTALLDLFGPPCCAAEHDRQERETTVRRRWRLRRFARVVARDVQPGWTRPAHEGPAFVGADKLAVLDDEDYLDGA